MCHKSTNIIKGKKKYMTKKAIKLNYYDKNKGNKRI